MKKNVFHISSYYFDMLHQGLPKSILSHKVYRNSNIWQTETTKKHYIGLPMEI